MKKECKIIAEVACEIQLIISEYNNISKSNHRNIIMGITDKMINSNLFNECNEDDIAELVSNNIHLYIDINNTFDKSFF